VRFNLVPSDRLLFAVIGIRLFAMSSVGAGTRLSGLNSQVDLKIVACAWPAGKYFLSLKTPFRLLGPTLPYYLGVTKF